MGEDSGVGDGDGLGVGDGVGLGVGLGFGVGLGCGEGVGLGVGVGVGFGVGEGLAVAVAVAVAVGFGTTVALGAGRGGDVAATLGRGRVLESPSGRTVGYVSGGFEVELGVVSVGVVTARGVGTGDAMMIGDGLGVGSEGTRDNVSDSVGKGDGVSTGTGGAVSSGLIVAVGFDFAVAVGAGFGFALGVGDSGTAAGVLAWNGVEAASCARPNAATDSNAIARTNERMIVVSLWKISCRRTLSCTHRRGQEQYRCARANFFRYSPGR